MLNVSFVNTFKVLDKVKVANLQLLLVKTNFCFHQGKFPATWGIFCKASIMFFSK